MVEQKTPFEQVQAWTHRYIDEKSLERRFRYIRFSQGGVSRMASICGWIMGLSLAGEDDKAIYFANHLFQALDYLGQSDEITHLYESRNLNDGEVEIHERMVPRTLVVLHDDGCFHSFSFVRYSYVSPEKLEAENKRREEAGNRPMTTIWEDYMRVYGAPGVNYTPMYNGGLIYSGPGQGETFTVNLVDEGNPWRAHT